MTNRRMVLAAAATLTATALMVVNASAQRTPARASNRGRRIDVLDPVHIQQIPVSLKAPDGLMWRTPPNNRRGELWISNADPKDPKLVRVVPGASGATEVSIATNLTPGPMAVVSAPGRYVANQVGFWVLDRATNTAVLSSLDSRLPSRGPFSFKARDEKMAFDNHPRRSRIRGIAALPGRGPLDPSRSLWTCRGGGLCSTVEVWVLDDNHSLQLRAQFFPRCEPIAIAIDPGGRRLWILGERGEGRRPLLIERRLDGESERLPWQIASGASRSIVELDRLTDPVAMAASNDSVWVLTKTGPLAPARKGPTTHLYQYRVGQLPKPIGPGGTP